MVWRDVDWLLLPVVQIDVNIMKNQQISPWSFYNDYPATLPLLPDESSPNKRKLKDVAGRRKKRQASGSKIQLNCSLIEDSLVQKKQLPTAALHVLQKNNSKELDLKSTEQSLIGKYQDLCHNSVDLENQKQELEAAFQSELILRLISRQLKRERDHEAFLQLQQQQYNQRQKAPIKQSQFKLPKIEPKNRSTELAHKSVDEKGRKPVEYENQLLQDLIKYKVKSMTSHKMKALGVVKQLVPRSASHHSVFILH